MTPDPNQHPATAGQHAGRSDAELQEKITQLFLRRSKLTPDEAALLRQVFRVIINAHHDQVWDHLRRRRLKSHRAKELYQEVFIALYNYLLEHGFPDSMPGLVNEIVERRLMRNGRDEGRVPPMDAPVSSGSEKPRSAPDLDRAIDLRALMNHVVPQLSPELQKVARTVFMNGLSHTEAAEVLGLTEGQVKARVVAAKRTMRALAERLQPPSQRRA